LNQYLIPNDSKAAPYSFLMEISLLTKDTVAKLIHVNQPTTRGGGIVSSIIVYRNESVKLEGFSPDYACPGMFLFSIFHLKKVQKKSFKKEKISFELFFHFIF